MFPSALCPDGSEWYICAHTSPPFSGCCKSNACAQNQCPSKDLMAAIPSPGSSAALPHSPVVNPATTESTDSFPFTPGDDVQDAPSLPAASSSPSSMPATTTPSGTDSLSSRITIIGATIGGIGGVVILILLCAVFILYRRQKTSEESSSTHVQVRQGIINSRVSPAFLFSSKLPLVATSLPFVSQLAGSPISEMQSPSHAAVHEMSSSGHHELPSPVDPASAARTNPSASISDVNSVSNALPSSSTNNHAELPINGSLKVQARGNKDNERYFFKEQKIGKRLTY